MKKSKLYIFLLLIYPVTITSQTDDYGIWTSLEVEKKIEKWTFSSQAEIRKLDTASQLNRLSLEIAAGYQLFKPFKIGVSYQYISFYDSKYTDYQPRHRFTLFLQGKQKIGRFTFSLREKSQLTTKDESNRIKKKGKIDFYRINPEWTWRNQLKVAYDIYNFPINPSFAMETFYQLNNPDGNVFEKLRYTLAFNYKLNNQHSIEVFGLLDKDINVIDPVNLFVAGFGYTISF